MLDLNKKKGDKRMNNNAKDRTDLHNFVNNWVNQVMIENQISASMMEDALYDALCRVKDACLQEYAAYMSEQMAEQQHQYDIVYQELDNVKKEKDELQQRYDDISSLAAENLDLKRRQEDFDKMCQENELLSNMVEELSKKLDDMTPQEEYTLETLPSADEVNRKAPSVLPNKSLSDGNRRKKKGV